MSWCAMSIHANLVGRVPTLADQCLVLRIYSLIIFFSGFSSRRLSISIHVFFYCNTCLWFVPYYYAIFNSSLFQFSLEFSVSEIGLFFLLSKLCICWLCFYFWKLLKLEACPGKKIFQFVLNFIPASEFA